MEESKQLTIDADAELLAMIDRLVEITGRSPSEIIAEAVRRTLAQTVAVPSEEFYDESVFRADWDAPEMDVYDKL